MVWPSLSLAACRCRVGEHLLRLNGSSGATVANRLWRFPRAQVRTHRRETAELFASSTGIHCGNRLPIGGTGIELSVPIRGTVFLGRIKLALSAHTLTSVNNLGGAASGPGGCPSACPGPHSGRRSNSRHWPRRSNAISLLHQDVHVEGPEHLVLPPPGKIRIFVSGRGGDDAKLLPELRMMRRRISIHKRLRRTGRQLHLQNN
jgi:hypothetical protein